MHYLIILVHVIVCLALIMIVLLQQGKGAGMGAAFGGSSQAVFGSTGAAPFLTKVTAAAAIVFMLTCLSLAYMFGKGTTSSIMEGTSQPQAPITQQIPAPAEGQGGE
ncbi:MAG: preprotein translocase subunit SecG [Deltaproteobacteria bacterium]|nr:preprotein translocase subunit SecG [Deltaproteobacteria bacterium]